MKTYTVLVLVAFIIVGMEMASARTPLFQERQRPGICPRVSKGTAGICVQKCSGDASCPKRMKCCSNGCGRVCKTALPEKGGFGGQVKDGQGVY